MSFFPQLGLGLEPVESMLKRDSEYEAVTNLYMCVYYNVNHTVVAMPVSPPTQAAHHASVTSVFPGLSTIHLTHSRYSLNC